MGDKPKLYKLSQKEKRAIHNPEDYPIISVIHKTPLDVKKKIYSELGYIQNAAGGKVYNDGDKLWLEDRAHYLWQNKFHSDPAINVQHTPLFIQEVREGIIPIDYRLYFAARNPGLVNPDSMSQELISFLSRIYKASKGRFGLDPNSLEKKLA